MKTNKATIGEMEAGGMKYLVLVADSFLAMNSTEWEVDSIEEARKVVLEVYPRKATVYPIRDFTQEEKDALGIYEGRTPQDCPVCGNARAVWHSSNEWYCFTCSTASPKGKEWEEFNKKYLVTGNGYIEKRAGE